MGFWLGACLSRWFTCRPLKFVTVPMPCNTSFIPLQVRAIYFCLWCCLIDFTNIPQGERNI